ncbi:MAG: hypothetical protein F4W92_09110 [Gammaproteobacteria bacterium]|nr:hypothetical protein [Gammaproteobacteria bacterium]
MKKLSVSVLILAFLISGCASVNVFVPETKTVGSETTIPESTESLALTAETKQLSPPTNQKIVSSLNPLDPLFFVWGFLHGVGIGAIGWLFLGSVLSGL